MCDTCNDKGFIIDTEGMKWPCFDCRPKCHVCGKPTLMFCKKTPQGGWGSIKCGQPTCENCKCDCDTETTY